MPMWCFSRNLCFFFIEFEILISWLDLTAILLYEPIMDLRGHGYSSPVAHQQIFLDHTTQATLPLNRQTVHTSMHIAHPAADLWKYWDSSVTVMPYWCQYTIDLRWTRCRLSHLHKPPYLLAYLLNFIDADSMPIGRNYVAWTNATRNHLSEETESFAIVQEAQLLSGVWTAKERKWEEREGNRK